MNANQFNRRARKAARKKCKKLGRKLNPDEIKNMKIQTASPWLQVFVSLIGLIIIFTGIYFHPEHEIFWLSLILVIVGLCIVLVGLFGKKSTVEDVSGEIAGQAAEELIGGLFDLF